MDDAQGLSPIAAGLWAEGPPPRLIGGRKANGEIVFRVTTKGKWMISTVKMERLIDNPVADWQSYWGSLTWGYE